MNKLEDKIIKEFYKIETKKTLTDLMVRVVIGIILVTVLFIFSQWLYEIYKLQRTLDLFQIFNEDIGIIRNYLLDTCITIYDETPKILLVPMIVCGILFIYLIVRTYSNFYKIKNKVTSILKYWSHH